MELSWPHGSWRDIKCSVDAKERKSSHDECQPPG